MPVVGARRGRVYTDIQLTQLPSLGRTHMTLRNHSAAGEFARSAAPAIEKAMERAGEKDSRKLRGVLGDGPGGVTVRPASTESRRAAAAGNDVGLKRGEAALAGQRQQRAAGWGRIRRLPAPGGQ